MEFIEKCGLVIMGGFFLIFALILFIKANEVIAIGFGIMFLILGLGLFYPISSENEKTNN